MPLFPYEKMNKRTKGILVFCAVFTALLFVGQPRFFVQAKEGPKTQSGTLTQASILAVSDPALMELRESDKGALDGEVQSTIFRPSFSFNGVMASWPATLQIDDESLRLEIRVKYQDSWSGWIPLSALHDAPTDAPLPEDRTWSEPVFVDADEFQYRIVGTVTTASLETFREVSFTYIDSRSDARQVSWIEKLFGVRRATAGSPVPLIARSEWGADEQYRFSGDQELWQRTYQPAEKFIIHHTAGSDGGTDPAAVVRGIYYFHAVVLGWGDVGYNYLIDPAGNIYEGRYGGDGVVGGHTYNDQEHIDYNQGAIGIAFLGNFEGDLLTDMAQESATSLLAEKAQLFSVSPIGASPFRNRENLPNIIGHRDVDATACPGANIVSSLEAIRQASQTKLATLPLPPEPSIAAQLASAPLLELTAEAGKTAIATARYTNTSTVQWQSYVPSRQVTLRPLDHPSVLYSNSWIGQEVVSTGDAANVIVNGSGSFSFSIAAPTDKIAVQSAFALFSPNGTEMPGTRFQVRVSIQNLEYAGTIESITLARATFLKHLQTATVRVRNIGTKEWQPNSLMLNLFDVSGRTSVFRASSWPAVTGGFLLHDVVPPGGSVELRVQLRTPAAPGLYTNVFRLARADGGIFATEEYQSLSRADSPWKAELVSRSFPVAVKTGWKKTMTVKFKNTGITTWTRSSIALRLYDSGLLPSRFSHPLWRYNGGKFTLREKTVRPGEIGTFLVQVQSPSKRGLYKQIIRLEGQKKNVILQNTLYDFLTRVD